MKTFVRALLLCAFFSLFTFAQTAPTALLHKPSISTSQIVFTYGDDLWAGPRDGGQVDGLRPGLAELRNVGVSLAPEKFRRLRIRHVEGIDQAPATTRSQIDIGLALGGGCCARARIAQDGGRAVEELVLGLFARIQNPGNIHQRRILQQPLELAGALCIAALTQQGGGWVLPHGNGRHGRGQPGFRLFGASRVRVCVEFFHEQTQVLRSGSAAAAHYGDVVPGDELIQVVRKWLRFQWVDSLSIHVERQPCIGDAGNRQNGILAEDADLPIFRHERTGLILFLYHQVVHYVFARMLAEARTPAPRGVRASCALLKGE